MKYANLEKFDKYMPSNMAVRAINEYTKLEKQYGDDIFDYLYVLSDLNSSKEIELNNNEKLFLTDRIIHASYLSTENFLAADRVFAVNDMLTDGISDIPRYAVPPKASPEEMKEFLLNCDFDTFISLVDYICAINYEVYQSKVIEFNKKETMETMLNKSREFNNTIEKLRETDEKVNKLLLKCSYDESMLDVDSSYYKQALSIVEEYLNEEFPELATFARGEETTDIIFCGEGRYNYFYFNPDSNAGGQIVMCPFDKEDIIEIQNDKEKYLDVLAGHTQYLSDINHISFFNTMFDLCYSKLDGEFLGTDIFKVCEEELNMVTSNKDISKIKLNEFGNEIVNELSWLHNQECEKLGYVEGTSILEPHIVDLERAAAWYLFTYGPYVFSVLEEHADTYENGYDGIAFGFKLGDIRDFIMENCIEKTQNIENIIENAQEKSVTENKDSSVINFNKFTKEELENLEIEVFVTADDVFDRLFVFDEDYEGLYDAIEKLKNGSTHDAVVEHNNIEFFDGKYYYFPMHDISELLEISKNKDNDLAR